jgi:O-antigen ligase
MKSRLDNISLLGQFKDKYIQYHFVFPIAFAVLLPFGLLHNIVLGFWILFFLFFGIKKDVFRKVITNKILIISQLFFLLYVVHYFFTKNKLEAATAIEIKLSFLVFPFLFLAHQYSTDDTRKIGLAFVIGSTLTALFCLLRATFVYFTENKNEFFYGDFSIFLHSSYAAMYALLALLICITQFQFRHKNRWLSITYNVIVIMVLSISIFLYSSKMGIITFFLLPPIAILFTLAKRKSYRTIVSILSFGLLATFFAYRFIPEPFNRFKVAFQVSSNSENIDKNAIESTAVRILIWKEALQIIQTNLWLGVGPGDANETLQKAYVKNELTGANEKKLNAHNEFLQIGIGLGLIGILVFTTLFLLGFYQAFKDKNILFVLFLILAIFNLFVESMLQRQSGVLFFVFFLVLFLHPSFKTTISDKN